MKEILYTAELRGKLALSQMGEWFHEGKKFERKTLSDLFHRSIVWDPKLHSYFIEIGPQRATFDCEDTAYFVIDLDESVTPWQVVLAGETSGGANEELDPKSITVGDQGQFYCSVRDGHRARFTKGIHQRLLNYVIDENTMRISGQVISITNIRS